MPPTTDPTPPQRSNRPGPGLESTRAIHFEQVIDIDRPVEPSRDVWRLHSLEG